MPNYRVVIETRDGFEKYVEAASAEDAQDIVEAEDGWGSPEQGWKRTDDCYSGIESVEEIM